MSFEDALAFTLRWEGGYVNHPQDPGGPTNFGITQLEYDRYREKEGLLVRQVAKITDKEVRAIYERMYWKVARCDQLPAKLATSHFDAAVNHGPSQAAYFLQRALWVPDDGILGLKTMEAAKLADERIAVRGQLTLRREHYRTRPHRNSFIKGWYRRVSDLWGYLFPEVTTEGGRNESLTA